MATPKQLADMSAGFTATRSRTFSAPSIPNAGWHLTSFGTSFELARKLRTFLHSNIFRGAAIAKGSLDEVRLERCMRYCLELDKPSGPTLPPCTSRDDPRSRKLPGVLLTGVPTTTSELPRDLIHHRERYPETWFRFLPSGR